MSDSQIIKPPNGLRKAKIGTGKGKLDLGLLQHAEKVVKQIQSEYTEWADEDLGALEASLADLQSGKDDQGPIVKDLYRISLDLKGSGGSFGFLMMSEVAGSLNDFLSSRPDLTRLDIDVVASHVSALRAIYVESIRDDGGNTGRSLLVGLMKLIEKVNAAARK
ncbi:MAG: Hpt domain-containing protein [Proteobacteria bacterium]|nr:Hpt domain-containing protein [Pseudomonadota bacterium]